MKKFFLLFTSILLVLLIYCTDVYAADISKKSVSLYIGKQTSVRIKGSDSKETTITKVKTSNKKVATINNKGVIKGIGKGSCIVAIKSADDKIYKCKVKVCEPRLNKTSLNLYVDDKFDLNLKGTDAKRVWYSDNDKIVKIKANGLIKGVRCGTTKVHVKVKNKIYTCKVNVKLKINSLKGQKVSIIGDSISTFEGYISKGYKDYYSKYNLATVSNTWWDMLNREIGLNLLKNCSWSSSTCTGNSLSTAYASCSTKRIDDLAKDGNKPDIVICYIGINDFIRDIPKGDWFTTKSELNDNENVDNFSEAYSLMLNKIHDTYPKAKIFCCTLVPINNYAKDKYYCVNKRGVKLSEYNKVIKNVAKIYNAKILDIYNCGFNKTNFDEYTVDGRLHPNQAGMVLIKNKMITDLKKYYK